MRFPAEHESTYQHRIDCEDREMCFRCHTNERTSWMSGNVQKFRIFHILLYTLLYGGIKVTWTFPKVFLFFVLKTRINCEIW